MAFDFSSFSVCQVTQTPGLSTNSVPGNATGNGLPIATYQTNDNTAVVTAANYFLPVNGFLKVGSAIWVAAGDGSHIIWCNVCSSANVQTTVLV